MFEHVLLALPEAFEKLLAVDRLDAAALEVVIAAVERLAKLIQLLDVGDCGVLDNVVGRLAAQRSEILELLFCLGGDCLLYTSPSPRDISGSRMPSSA